MKFAFIPKAQYRIGQIIKVHGKPMRVESYTHTGKNVTVHTLEGAPRSGARVGAARPRGSPPDKPPPAPTPAAPRTAPSGRACTLHDPFIARRHRRRIPHAQQNAADLGLVSDLRRDDLQGHGIAERVRRADRLGT